MDYRDEVNAAYMAIPFELRLKAARIGLEIAERSLRRREAELAAKGPTAWLARRQLPMTRRSVEYHRRTILECEQEIAANAHKLP
jgi:hypothetical protein